MVRFVGFCNSGRPRASTAKNLPQRRDTASTAGKRQGTKSQGSRRKSPGCSPPPRRAMLPALSVPPVGATHMPEPDNINSAISQGVERASNPPVRLAEILHRRHPTRHARWHLAPCIAANATDTGDTEQSHGHAD